MSGLTVLVTGEHAERRDLPTSFGSQAVEWISLPVLDFQRLPVPHEILRRCVDRPFDWLVFSSPRAVEFWSETLIENQIDFPVETQIACMGEGTATASEFDGFTPDFFPTEPGTEGFLAEFEALLANNLQKPTVLIPASVLGRPTLKEKLVELGCEVTSFPLYQTQAKKDLGAVLQTLRQANPAVLVFTSPSSVDAILSLTSLPAGIRTVVAIGEYTAERLRSCGVEARILPGSDLARLAEVW